MTGALGIIIGLILSGTGLAGPYDGGPPNLDRPVICVGPVTELYCAL